ncbi:hypothetical protein PZE18_27145, partial [Escherichia coli]|nr:hypothetical protein [Escherichia coli]
CHLMISERINDGIERPAAQWFKRYNGKTPEKGGAQKTEALKPKAWLERFGLLCPALLRGLAVVPLEPLSGGPLDAVIDPLGDHQVAV